MIRLGYSFIGVSPTLIITAQDIEAQLSASPKVSYLDTVIHDPINPAINTLLVILGIAMAILIIKYKWFITIHASSHFGIYYGPQNEYHDQNNQIFLSFQLMTKRWFKPYLKEILIRLLAYCLESDISFGNISIAGNSKIYYITKESGAYRFKFVSPIKFSIDFNTGAEKIRHQEIDIPLSAINWEEGGKPFGIENFGFYGNCTVSFFKVSSPPSRNFK